MSRALENENGFSKSGSSHNLVFTVISRFCKSSHIYFFAVKQNFREQIPYTELTLFYRDQKTTPIKSQKKTRPIKFLYKISV
ncbi:hypothetical protein [Leptospira kirschneri]|uniref:hypothetical protein n=1 Tax=Leptospira kirschneri TaxID=29507 RepID=UPI00034CA063|nr:hypothetical protein [Leptospira kirschneri]